MGLGGLKTRLVFFIAANGVVTRVKELSRMGKLGTALIWFSGALGSYVVTEVLQSCPTLAARAPAILGIGCTAALGFWLNVPKTVKDLSWKFIVLGGLSAGWYAAQQAFGEACPSIAANFWGFFASLALGGLHLFMESPKEATS